MMGSKRVRLTLSAAAAAALLAAAPAKAQPTAADRETARSMMQEGRDLRDKGDLKGALQRFKAADDIMHVPTTGFEVARTQVALGMLVEALDTIAAIRKTPTGADDPQPFKDARLKADELDAQLEAKVPSITITVTGGSENDTPAVSVDGVSLPPAAAILPRKVDPGHHVITARSGTGQAKTEIDVNENEKKEVTLALVAVSGTPVEAPVEGEGNHGIVHTPTVLTYAGVVAGGVGLVAGAVTGILTLGKASTVKSDCKNNVCVSGTDGASALSAGNTLGTVSTISFAVAGAGAALAVVSLIVGHKAPEAAPANTPPEGEGNAGQADPGSAPRTTEQSRLRVSPWIGVGSAGLSGTF
jgi:hypothetical protein